MKKELEIVKVVKIVSEVLLMLEAVAVAIFSIYGFVITLDVITSFARGSPDEHLKVSPSDFFGAIFMLCALISGWRIFAWVITNGPSKGIYINPVWWVFAALGACLTIQSLGTFYVLGVREYSQVTMWDLFSAGGLLLVPFAHLIIEAIWQWRMYKTLQPTHIAH